jgi:hypothetical protein
MGTDPAAQLAQARRFARGLGGGSGEVIVETSAACDAAIEEQLRAEGFVVGYTLPVHVIDLGPVFFGHLRDAPAGFTVREVTDDATLADFAFVQDAAYRESYDMPRGSMSLFFSSLSSCVGPDVVAAVLYDGDDRPVRTAALVRARGIVSGVGGAALPSVRGQHLGEPLMRHLGEASLSRFASSDVVHITMPAAQAIARRLELGVVDQYRRWVPGGGVEW